MFVGFSFAAGDEFRLRLHSKIKGGVCSACGAQPPAPPGCPPHGCWHGDGSMSSPGCRVTAQERRLLPTWWQAGDPVGS